jgi:hypothetical protein
MPRAAWLVLNGMRTYLDDVAGGWVCTALDLGFPDIRDVTNPAPIQHGLDDQTKFFGGRVVTATITAVPDGRLSLDSIVEQFGRYMDPGARPELHYTRQSDDPDERMIVLRASAWSSPMGVPTRRDLQLSWIAPDALIRSAVPSTSSTWSGSGEAGGRVYEPPWIPDRDYTDVAGTGPIPGQPISRGDLPVAPLLMIYGPITQPMVSFGAVDPDRNPVQGQVAFKSSFTVGSGEWVKVDCKARSAHLNGDPKLSVFGSLDFEATQWPLIYPLPWVNVIHLAGSSTSDNTLAEVIWQDAYLA